MAASQQQPHSFTIKINDIEVAYKEKVTNELKQITGIDSKHDAKIPSDLDLTTNFAHKQIREYLSSDLRDQKKFAPLADAITESPAFLAFNNYLGEYFFNCRDAGATDITFTFVILKEIVRITIEDNGFLKEISFDKQIQSLKGIGAKYQDLMNGELEIELKKAILHRRIRANQLIDYQAEVLYDADKIYSGKEKTTACSNKTSGSQGKGLALTLSYMKKLVDEKDHDKIKLKIGRHGKAGSIILIESPIMDAKAIKLSVGGTPDGTDTLVTAPAMPISVPATITQLAQPKATLTINLKLAHANERSAASTPILTKACTPQPSVVSSAPSSPRADAKTGLLLGTFGLHKIHMVGGSSDTAAADAAATEVDEPPLKLNVNGSLN